MFSKLFKWLPLLLVPSLYAGSVTCTMKLDRDILPVADYQTAVLQVTLTGAKPARTATRAPVNVVVVLDRSGSMSGDKIEQAKAATLEIIDRMGPEDYFSLVTYSSGAQTIIAPQNNMDLKKSFAPISAISTGGSTALFAGVSQGAYELRKYLRRDMINRVILLSDGQANVGPDSPSELGRLGASLSKEGISVTTVGLGNDYNEDIMTSLSQSSDGNTWYVEESQDLARIFAKELGDVFTVVATEVALVLEFSEDVQPLRLIGREGRIRGKRVEIDLSQIYGDQKKLALLEIGIRNGKAMEERKMAVAKVQYADTASRSQAQASSVLNTQFSPKREVYAAASNNNYYVTQQYLINSSVLEQDQAVELADKGNTQEALKILNKSKLDLEQAGKANKDELLLEQSRQVEAIASRLEREKALSKKDRKLLRTNSYQMRNQQQFKDLKGQKSSKPDKDEKGSKPNKKYK